MRKPREIRISIRTVEKTTIVDLEGDIDVGTSTVLRAQVFEALPGASRLALNLSGIRYLDSAGIATMVEIRQKTIELEKDLVLFGLGSHVHAVLKLTRLLGFFRIVDNEEQAVAAEGTSHG
jgi:anti-sigma B factor antagonist